MSHWKARSLFVMLCLCSSGAIAQAPTPELAGRNPGSARDALAPPPSGTRAPSSSCLAAPSSLPGTCFAAAPQAVLLSAQIRASEPSALRVTRTDDDAEAPVPGMLRYAINTAGEGATITFDPVLNGKIIRLDRRSPGNHLKVTHSLNITGPGADLLAIDGGNATRILFISGGTVQLAGVTLTGGSARGGDGGAATGGAGGGGGAAGLGGAIFLHSGTLTLSGVVMSGNRSSGGNGGGGGAGFASGRGGGGGGFGGGSLGGSAGGPGNDLQSNDPTEGLGGRGGGGDTSAEPGGEGGWAGGGGGGGFLTHTAGGRGAPGGPSGFAGGVGGAGGYLDEDGAVIPPGGGYGGSALGGAIFVRSGKLQLFDTAFLNNSTSGGLGASGAPNGIAKGGALFICSSSFCGPGHDAVAEISGKTTFRGNSALQGGEDPVCNARDDSDVCGLLVIPLAANDIKASR